MHNQYILMLIFIGFLKIRQMHTVYMHSMLFSGCSNNISTFLNFLLQYITKYPKLFFSFFLSSILSGSIL